MIIVVNKSNDYNYYTFYEHNNNDDYNDKDVYEQPQQTYYVQRSSGG